MYKMADEILEKWMRLFNMRSFCNEVPGQILFHVLLGQKLKDLKVYTKPGKWIDLRIHFGHLQDSGSGKGEELEFELEMAKRLKLKTESLGGSVTDAALLSNNKRAGILSQKDIVCYPEARVLFDPNKWNSEIREILIAVMEPLGSEGNKYFKKLGGYEEGVITQSSASLVFTTRPISNVRGEIPAVGHLQRAIFYPRELDNKTRQEMDKKNIEMLSNGKIEWQKESKELADEIDNICQKAIVNNLRISNETEFLKELQLKNIKFSQKISEISDKEDKGILHTFTARYTDQILKLAFHHAVMRESSNVEIVDLEYAFELIWKVFEQLCLWVEIVIEKDWRKVSDREIKLKQIKSWIEWLEKNKGKATLSDLAKFYAKKYGRTEMAGRLFIEQHAEEIGFKIPEEEIKEK